MLNNPYKHLSTLALAAAFLLPVACSSVTDEPTPGTSQHEINVTASSPAVAISDEPNSRGNTVTGTNLQKFFIAGYRYIGTDVVEYLRDEMTRNTSNNQCVFNSGKKYWPVDKLQDNIHFYAFNDNLLNDLTVDNKRVYYYDNATGQGPDQANEVGYGSVAMLKYDQVESYGGTGEHVFNNRDFMYAYTRDRAFHKDNGTFNLEFVHALSAVRVKVVNNTEFLNIGIRGMDFVNVYISGDMHMKSGDSKGGYVWSADDHNLCNWRTADVGRVGTVHTPSPASTNRVVRNGYSYQTAPPQGSAMIIDDEPGLVYLIPQKLDNSKNNCHLRLYANIWDTRTGADVVADGQIGVLLAPNNNIMYPNVKYTLTYTFKNMGNQIYVSVSCIEDWNKNSSWMMCDWNPAVDYYK